MTTNNPDASRKEFEAYANAEFVPHGAKLTYWISDGKFVVYDDVVINTHWNTWQAARSDKGEAYAYEVDTGDGAELVYPQAIHKYNMYSEDKITHTLYLAAPQQAIPADARTRFEESVNNFSRGQKLDLTEHHDSQYGTYLFDATECAYRAFIAAPTAPIDNVRENKS
jgi:hypothetical protein